MDRARFAATLIALDIPDSIVSFNGAGLGENYAIEHGLAGWAVYYAERGQRREEQSFASESVALRYLIGWIIDASGALGR